MNGNRFHRILFSNRFVVVAAILAFTGVFCGPSEGESPTRGNLVVLTAESVAPVMTEIVNEFNDLYKDAHVTLLTSTSREAIVKLLNNEAKVIVATRELNGEERDVIARYNLHVDTFRVAYDGLAAIVHPSNPVTQLSFNELSQIVTGKARSWREFSLNGRKSPEIFIAVGGPNTSAHETIKTKIANGEALTTRLYPCSTSTQVLELTRRRPEAIGFVGTAWLFKDSSNVKVLEIGAEVYFADALGRQVKYFGPHQAHIYRGFYPLRRTIYIYSREKGFGLGAGFTAFVTSAAGQKIFLNNGMVPATMPVKLTSKTQS